MHFLRYLFHGAVMLSLMPKPTFLSPHLKNSGEYTKYILFVACNFAHLQRRK